MVPPFGIDPNDDEQTRNWLASMNPELASSLDNSDYSGPPPGSPYANNPAATMAATANFEATHPMFASTPIDTAPEHGVPTVTGQNADLHASSYDATITELEKRQATAHQNALDMLQKALNNQPEISSSQGIAAALLAAIPAIGGGIMGKIVGNPKIPAGTYFPGMSGAAFNQEFGVGGNAMAAEGAQIGGASALDYLNRVQKDQTAKTPIYEKMAALESQDANTLEGRLESTKLAKANAEERRAMQDESLRNSEKLFDYKNTIDKGNMNPLAQAAAEKLGRGVPPAEIPDDEYSAFMKSQGAKGLSAISALGNEQVRAKNAERLQNGGFQTLQVDNPNSPYKPIDPQTFNEQRARGQIALTTKDGEALKETGTAVSNAINQIKIAKQAIADYGLVQTQAGKDPEGLKKLGEITEQIHSAQLQVVQAMSSLNPTLAKGGMTDTLREQLGDLGFVPNVIAELNPAKVISAGLQKPEFVIGKLNDVERELQQRFGDALRSSGLRYAAPIGGGAIVPHDPMGPFMPGQPLASASSGNNSPTKAQILQRIAELESKAGGS